MEYVHYIVRVENQSSGSLHLPGESCYGRQPNIVLVYISLVSYCYPDVVWRDVINLLGNLLRLFNPVHSTGIYEGGRGLFTFSVDISHLTFRFTKLVRFCIQNVGLYTYIISFFIRLLTALRSMRESNSHCSIDSRA